LKADFASEHIGQPHAKRVHLFLPSSLPIQAQADTPDIALYSDL
jgi:hypothetical protein